MSRFSKPKSRVKKQSLKKDPVKKHRVKKDSVRTLKPSSVLESVRFEVEFLPGLEPFVSKELQALGCQEITQTHAERLQCSFSGDARKLNTLRKAVAVYYIQSFAIPRPKALLGDAHFKSLLDAVAKVLSLYPKGAFKAFRISAAGQDSPVFLRLRQVLAQQLSLPFDPEGDLLLTIRPGQPQTWEVLVRLTPRPLSARPWRVCNMSGGLNATLASVMNDLARIQMQDRYLNAMCGSGTLLIEKKLTGQTTGLDLNPEALECARNNLQAAGIKAEFVHRDATQTPFAEASFEVLSADLPWGDAVGSTEENATLYPAFLAEMARVATANARLVILTHQIRLFEKVIEASAWQIRESFRVYHGGHYPRVYLLQKR